MSNKSLLAMITLALAMSGLLPIANADTIGSLTVNSLPLSGPLGSSNQNINKLTGKWVEADISGSIYAASGQAAGVLQAIKINDYNFTTNSIPGG